MLKYLRIAASLLSITACVVVIAFWIRRYSWCDIVCIRIDGEHDQWLQSLDGKLTYDPTTSMAQKQFLRWIVHPADRWRKREERSPLPETDESDDDLFGIPF